MLYIYADPPYPGCAHLYPENEEVNHRHLLRVLDQADGWALSTSSTALQYVLSLCPPGIRIAAWVKPFAIFKPNVNPGYCWEPVIWRPGRKRTRQQPTARDWVSANVTLKKGVPGAKPEAFYRWLLDLLNIQADDTLIDLYPGTNSLQAIRQQYHAS